MKALFSGLVLALGGCAFGGVTDYAIDGCDPRVTDLAADVCNRLNAGLPASECNVWQCSRVTARCAQGPRDFDRDGDPAPECGGKDCDDRSATTSSLAAEVCDGVDNNCNGAVDEGVFGTTGAPAELFKTELAYGLTNPALGMPSGGEAFAPIDTALGGTAVYVGATTGGMCLKSTSATHGPSPAGCTFLAGETALDPGQPLARIYGVGTGVAFTTSKLCPNGVLQYRYAADRTVSASTTCGMAPVAKGAALPNLEFFRDGAVAVATFYEERSPDLASSAGCDAVGKAPAPLTAVGILSPTATPSLDTVPIVLSTGARSRGRAALARLDVDAPDLGGIFAASPDGAGASVWSLYERAGHLALAADKIALANVDGALSTSLALAKIDGAYHAAVAADIGCTDTTVRVAFGTVTASTDAPAIAFTPAIDVVAGPGARFQPIVRWTTTPAGAFWVVAWIEAGGVVRARRYASTGAAVGDAFDVAAGASVIDATADGRVVFFAPAAGVNASAFEAATLGCAGK